MLLYHTFPDLRWLKKQAETSFVGAGWPNVLLNVKSGVAFRDNIPGPLSFFSNVSGESFVSVNGRTSSIKNDYFFISNNTQRYTLEIKSAETFNVHFGVDGQDVGFYNKLYPKDDFVRAIQRQLLQSISTLEKEELLTMLYAYLLKVNRGEKSKVDKIAAAKVSTREEVLRRLHLATDYIYNRYASDVSLEELSKVSMLSKFHFLRAFRQAFGIPPHRFLNQVRISKAKELLKVKSNVALVGRQVGITESSSFSRLFRNETGIYPTAFQK
ncbi:MAG TPA: AraC family transcriptional regulator [Cyclobacteriaceae bacterium]